MKALLLSGGLESTAIAYWLRPSIGVTVDYGQPCAAAEIRAARAIASELSMKHHCVRVSPYPPRLPSPQPPKEAQSIWWPYRNQLLLTLAAITTWERDVSEIQIGLVKGDIYKDCTDEFVRLMNRLFRIQERPVHVIAPARRLTTLELLKKSRIPLRLLGVTTSCHAGNVPCGFCAGCSKSAQAIRDYKTLMS